MFPVGLPVIPFAASDDGKTGPFIEPARRLIIFLDLEEYGAHATARKMAEMCQQQVVRQATAALIGGNRDRQDLGLVGGQPRHREADDLSTLPQAMNQRIALAQHGLEFGFAPAAVKRCAVQLRQPGGVARGRGLDHRRAAAPPSVEPGTYSTHHDEDGCAALCSASCEGLASGARR